MLPIYQNDRKSDSKVFWDIYRRVTRRRVMRHFTWYRPIRKRFIIKPPSSISKATPIDLDSCRQQCRILNLGNNPARHCYSSKSTMHGNLVRVFLLKPCGLKNLHDQHTNSIGRIITEWFTFGAVYSSYPPRPDSSVDAPKVYMRSDFSLKTPHSSCMYHR